MNVLRRNRLGIAALGFVVLAATACGSGDDAARTRAERAAKPNRSELKALRFRATTLNGATFDTSDYVGKVPVAFWAWAPWCPTCNREAPTVHDAIERFGDRVTFVGVPGRDRTDAMRVFVQRHDLGMIPHVVDADGGLWRRLGVPGQPMWVLVGADGEVQRFFGVLDEADLQRALSRLAGRHSTSASI